MMEAVKNFFAKKDRSQALVLATAMTFLGLVFMIPAISWLRAEPSDQETAKQKQAREWRAGIAPYIITGGCLIVVGGWVWFATMGKEWPTTKTVTDASGEHN